MRFNSLDAFARLPVDVRRRSPVANRFSAAFSVWSQRIDIVAIRVVFAGDFINVPSAPRVVWKLIRVQITVPFAALWNCRRPIYQRLQTFRFRWETTMVNFEHAESGFEAGNVTKG